MTALFRPNPFPKGSVASTVVWEPVGDRRDNGVFHMTEQTMTHSHDAEGEKAHEGLAFTTWVDLSLAFKQAEAIVEALVRKRPNQKYLFWANYRLLEHDLPALDRRIKSIVSPCLS